MDLLKLLGFKKTNDVSIEVEQLRGHPIFEEIGVIDAIRLSNLRINDPMKRKMVIAYLHILFEETGALANTLLDSYPNCLQSATTIATLTNQTMKTVKERALSSGIATVFLDKYEPLCFETLSTITDIIIEVHQHRLFNTNYGAMCQILSLILTFVRISMNQVETIVGNMNGELSHALAGSLFDKE